MEAQVLDDKEVTFLKEQFGSFLKGDSQPGSLLNESEFVMHNDVHGDYHTDYGS